jgi:methionyl-tRNA formyltransferase
LGEGLRIVFLGTADFAVPTLRALASGGDEIAGVVTRPDRPAGRGRHLRAPPVKSAARELGLTVFQPERVSASEGRELLSRLDPDVLLVCAFGEILSSEVLGLAGLAAVNIHASLLPSYRGAAPIQRALMAGETRTGVTMQWMAQGLDVGDILLQREVDVGPEEDFGGLHDRLAHLGASAALEGLALIRQGGAPRTAQRHQDATSAPPIRGEDLVMDWGRPAVALGRLVRALSPRPGARTTRAGRLLKVLSAREGKNEGEEKGIAGQIMELTTRGFWVAAGEGRLLVLSVQPAGRRTMPAGDFANGYRLLVGERLGV